MELRGAMLLLLLMESVWLVTGSAQQAGARAVWAMSGQKAELPCAPDPREANDRAVLVLWYRSSDTRQPVYSYDARSGDFQFGNGWADPDVLGSRASFNTVSDPPMLVLGQVLPTDQGVYTCRIDYYLSPSTTALVNLTVAIPPGSPLVVWRGAGVAGILGPLDEGAHVELLCRSVGGRPQPQVTWWWRGAKMPSQHTASLHSGEGTVESSLVVKASRSLHGATLTCQAQTPAPSPAATAALPQPLSTFVTLNVTLPPLSVEIQEAEGPVTAGAIVTLECRSFGSRPPADITWRLGHNRLPHVSHRIDGGGNITTTTLRLTVRREHNGETLACTAANPLLPHASLTATRKLEVFYAPDVQLKLGRHVDGSRLQEGNDVFFECRVRANPPALRMLWYHNGAELVHDVAAGVVVSGQSLAVRHLRREHSGHYTCAATNQEGHNTSNAVQLTVKHSPVCARGDVQRTLGVARGTPVIVTCRVEAEPARHLSWTWVRILEDGEEQPVHAKDIKSAGLTSSVEVTPLTERDYGELLCRAKNTVGRQKEPCIVSLVPAGPPDPPHNCTTALPEPLHSPSKQSLVVTCFEGFDGGLPQEFMLEAWQNSHIVANFSSDFPEWAVSGLKSALDTTLLIVAVNARGRSETLRLEVPTALAQQQAAPETESLSVPALLGVAVGVVIVLVLSLVVSVVIARRKCSCDSKDESNGPTLEETPAGSVWECYEPDPQPQARHQHTLETDAHANMYTTLLNTHPDSPRTHKNGRMLSYSPKQDINEVSCQISDSCSSNSSCGSKADSVVEVCHFSPQCWHEQVGKTRLNQGSSLTSLPSNGSPNLDPLKGPYRSRNGLVSSNAPRHITSHPHSSIEGGFYPMIVRGNECDCYIPQRQNRRKFVHFQDGKKQVLQQHIYPPKETYVVAAPVAMHDLQASPINKGKTRSRYNFHPPRKPPRTFSQTSLTKSPATGDSFTSLCSSVSQPYSHTTRGAVEWDCPQAPLAEDEVKDAYALLQPSGG
ncbi:nephrin-like isoform X2 [Eriocheir sinensis]|uniref:nephrin-like isoform X2 n=1 Tax=Eriocheir sinensis TaxID=95602 RepID=UPI0021C9DD82|nr:nephrin-like isoform X2 [Eriocheir sinensis]